MEILKGPIKKIAVAATAAALVVSGCGDPNQVSGTNIVDCQNGQKTGETTTNFQAGSTLNIGGDWSSQAAHISFERSGILKVQQGGNDSNRGVLFLSSDNHNLNDGEVGIDQAGTIYVNSNGVNYEITDSVSSQGVTQVDVKAQCQK
jgi:hypothetical protein